MDDLEIINEGHNIIDRGFALVHNPVSNRTLVAFRSRGHSSTIHAGRSYLAYTEIDINGVSTPIQINKAANQIPEVETLAFVVADPDPNPNPNPNLNPNLEAAAMQRKFLFTAIEGELHMRTQVDDDDDGNNSLWGPRARVFPNQIPNQIGVGSRLTATWIGGPGRTINVYAWNGNNQITELVGIENGPAEYQWAVGVNVGNLPAAATAHNQANTTRNRQLAVRVVNGVINLLYVGADDRIYRATRAGDAWNHNILIQSGHVHPQSPIAIMALPPIPGPLLVVDDLLPNDLLPNDLLPDDLFPAVGPVIAAAGYPDVPIGLPAIADPVADPNNYDAAQFVVAYVDRDYTVHIRYFQPDDFQPDGALIGTPQRLGRLRASQAENRNVLSLAIAPGPHPRSVNVFAVTSLHGTETLVTYSQVSSPTLVVAAARAEEVFLQLHAQRLARLVARNQLAVQLNAANQAVQNNFPNQALVMNRDAIELGFLLARAQWNAATIAAVNAQNPAIIARNNLRNAGLFVKLTPIKTETCIIEQGQIILDRNHFVTVD